MNLALEPPSRILIPATWTAEGGFADQSPQGVVFPFGLDRDELGHLVRGRRCGSVALADRI